MLDSCSLEEKALKHSLRNLAKKPPAFDGRRRFKFSRYNNVALSLDAAGSFDKRSTTSPTVCQPLLFKMRLAKDGGRPLTAPYSSLWMIQLPELSGRPTT